MARTAGKAASTSAFAGRKRAESSFVAAEKTHMEMTRQPGSGIWWLHPAFAFTAAGVGISICAWQIPEATYRIYWRTPKFFDPYTLQVTLACVAVFGLGSWLGGRLAERRPGAGAWRGDDGAGHDLLWLLFRLSFWLCLTGYSLWTFLAIRRGITLDLVAEMVTGTKGAMYEARYTYLPTVGGVTTLTQFGTAAMVLGAILGCRFGWRAVWPRCAVIGSAAVLRALLNSERFALFELIIPFLLAWLAMRYLGATGIRAPVRWLVRSAPVTGLAALLLIFTGFEYFRSWSNYYAERQDSLWEFGAMRLLGYYVTSFNNGAYLLQRLEPLHAPYFTLHFLWGLPLTGTATKHLFANPLLDTADKWFYFPFLESGANVEFNNADGMLFPLMDFGVAGGLIYWLIAGLVCGTVYRLFCEREMAGLLLYPVLYLGLLEVPLALYWAEGRAFPSLFLLAGTPALLGLLGRQPLWRTLVPAGLKRAPRLLT